MNRIVYLGLPAHGHTTPALAVLRELIQRGHRVSVCNTEDFRSRIERAGVAFHPYPATDLTSEAIKHSLRQGQIACFWALLLRATEVLLPWTQAELARERPDLVIFDSAALWGPSACVLLGLPSVSFITHFLPCRTIKELGVPGPVRQVLRLLPLIPTVAWSCLRLALRHGKASRPPGGLAFPVRGRLNLVFSSRELQPDSALVDSSFRFVGPALNPDTRPDEQPLAMPEGQRVVYISLGTVISNCPGFYRTCFEAFGQYPAQFVVATGKDVNLNALGLIPANFIVRNSVPQLTVLQHADVFLTHGGTNSVIEGLYHGVPLVVMPFTLDQLTGARRVEALGAGIALEGQMARGRVTTAELRQALDAVLGESRYRDAAAQVSRSLRSAGGYRQAADEIETFLNN